MSRRQQADSNEFGSDSFLDIIANIVGILIILIVVAGVKVARQPAVEVEAATAEVEVAELEEPVLPEPRVLPGPTAEEIAARQRLADEAWARADQERATREAQRQDEIDAERAWNEQLSNLNVELTTTQSRTVEAEKQLALLQETLRDHEEAQASARAQALQQDKERDTLTTSLTELEGSVASTAHQLTSYQSVLDSLTNRQSIASDALQDVAEETRALRETLDALEESRPKADRIAHRLSPVGQAAQGEELHFRIASGRIAHIPIEGLLERLRAQVSARRSLVMRFHRYEGVVGPVGGFRMQYIVQRSSVAPLQALQYGRSTFQVAVSRWTILPAETLEAEEISAALRIGSRFRQVLESAAPETTVTVWLYPGDFEKFGKVRELAHNLGLRVAARPLPDGIPIAGTPNGSRSSSQ